MLSPYITIPHAHCPPCMWAPLVPPLMGLNHHFGHLKKQMAGQFLSQGVRQLKQTTQACAQFFVRQILHLSALLQTTFSVIGKRKCWTVQTITSISFQNMKTCNSCKQQIVRHKLEKDRYSSTIDSLVTWFTCWQWRFWTKIHWKQGKPQELMEIMMRFLHRNLWPMSHLYAWSL